MRSDYTEVFRDPAAVAKYEEQVYAAGTFSSAVSRRQQQWLRGFVAAAFPVPPVHHDFACGTGRVMRMLSGVVAEGHGYDTSEAMLAKARSVGTPGTLHLVGEVGPLPAEPVSADPVLVTVFRLLLNAGPDVRDRAMEFAAGMLPDRDAGLLVLENHGNSRSVRHLRGVFGRLDHDNWFSELGHDQVRRLLDRHGFELITMQGFTLLTRGFYRIPPLSWVLPPVDSLLARRHWCASVATDVVYVARRKA